jgi:solute carrier family 50 protein (sugar transporter)
MTAGQKNRFDILLLTGIIVSCVAGFSPSSHITKSPIHNDCIPTGHFSLFSLQRASPQLVNKQYARATPTTTTMSLTLSPGMLNLAKTVAPRLGIFTSTALYLSPMASFLSAVKSKSIGELNPLPLNLMAIVSIAWLAYGLCVRDPFVALSNILGCIASIGYVVGVLPLLKGDDKLRFNQIVLIGGAAVSLCLWTYLSLSNMPVLHMGNALGMYASILFVVFCVSPLSTMRTVLLKRDSASILGSLTLTQVVNTSLWSAYGFAVGDSFVWGPNLVGLGLGLVQLALKLVFPSKNKVNGL